MVLFGSVSCVEESYVLDSASLMYSIQIDMAVEQKAKIYVDDTDSKTLPLVVGESVQLEFISDPADLSTLTYPGVMWTSSNESVVTVDKEGQVTAKGAGVAVITVTPSTINVPATSSLKVTVVSEVTKVTSITISDDSDHVSEFSPLPSCYEGETMTLTAVVNPSEATYKTVLWTSSDESKATVDPITGVVTGVSQGEVKIVASALDADKVKAEYPVYIDRVITPEGVRITNAPAADDIFSVGDGYYQIDFETSPAVSTKSKLTWTSSDPAVATVDARGKVTFKKYGTVEITVKAPDSETVPDGFFKAVTAKFVIPAGFYREHFDDEGNINWNLNPDHIKKGGAQEWKINEYNEHYLYFTPYKDSSVKLRGDIQHKLPMYLSGDFPILCLRLDDVNDHGFTGTNIKFDSGGKSEIDGADFKGEIGGGNRTWTKKYTCSDKSALLIYDLSSEKAFKTGGALAAGNIVSFTTFQLKYADIKMKDGSSYPENLDDLAAQGLDHHYRMFWFHTFRSMDELNTYLDEWSSRTGITYN